MQGYAALYRRCCTVQGIAAQYKALQHHTRHCSTIQATLRLSRTDGCCCTIQGYAALYKSLLHYIRHSCTVQDVACTTQGNVCPSRCTGSATVAAFPLPVFNKSLPDPIDRKMESPARAELSTVPVQGSAFVKQTCIIPCMCSHYQAPLLRPSIVRRTPLQLA